MSVLYKLEFSGTKELKLTTDKLTSTELGFLSKSHLLVMSIGAAGPLGIVLQPWYKQKQHNE